jgi:hypothetical protein
MRVCGSRGNVSRRVADVKGTTAKVLGPDI